jgi:adenylate cyclase
MTTVRDAHLPEAEIGPAKDGRRGWSCGLEFEYPVPILDAKALMSLRMGSVIEKVRYVVPWGDLVWEIDVFSGENAGLTIAEIELRGRDQRIELPDWIGDEVTTQPQYNNSSLALHPFCSWSRLDT